MDEFETGLRDKLIGCLNLEEVDPAAITRDITLFGEGLGLDSIDAIEIEVMIKTQYGIDILTSERNRSTFGTFGALCDFVRENQNRDVA